MSLNFKSKTRYIMANAFMLAYPYGTIRIMSSYNFSSNDIDKGPPMDENEKILSVTLDDAGNCLNGWICEHRWKPIVEMVKFRVNVHGTEMSKWKVFESSTLAFCRADKGFIAFSSSKFRSLADESIFVCVPTGKYCEVIEGYDDNGNCLSEIEVDSDRKAVIIGNGKSNSNGVIAFHVGSRLENV